MQKCNTRQLLSFDIFNVITGLMRTGKTYTVVYNLLAMREQYNIVTNIQGLTIFPFFKYPEFFAGVKQLHMYYNEIIQKEPARVDELLREKQRELNFFYDDDKEYFIVIDEAQNFFSKADPSLVFFITYLARFKMRILLITQNIALIHSSYAKLFVECYATVPAQKTLSDSYFYVRRYGNVADLTYNRNIVEQIKVPKMQCVFDYYSTPRFFSKAKKLYMRYVKILIVAFLSVILALGYVFYSFYNKIHAGSVSSSVSPSSVSSPPPSPPPSTPVFYVFCEGDFCISQEQYKKYLHNDDYYFPLLVLKRDLFRHCGLKNLYNNVYKLQKGGACYARYAFPYFIN